MATRSDKKNMVLLWTNQSPSSNFAGQTIPLSLSDYEFVLIIGDNYSTPGITYVGGDGDMLTTNYNGNHRIGQRKFSVTNTGVTFEDAFYEYAQNDGTTTNNSTIKPLRIYGIRA